MDQDDTVVKLVTENRKDPRNKIIIDGSELSVFASEELDTVVTISALSRAVAAYKNGTPNEDEWEEIDISTAWTTGADVGNEELAVVVRRM